jgi:hypothetical protein
MFCSEQSKSRPRRGDGEGRGSGHAAGGRARRRGWLAAGLTGCWLQAQKDSLILAVMIFDHDGCESHKLLIFLAMHSTTTINQLRLTTTSSATGFLFWSEVTLRDTDCLTARRRLRCAWRSSGARSGSCRTGWLRRTRTPNSPGKVRRSGRSDRGPHRHCESDAAAPSWQGSRRRSPRSAVEWSRNAARIAPHRGQRRQCAASYCRQVGVETHLHCA